MSVTNIEGFALSPQQKYIWLLEKGKKTYHSQIALSVIGELRIAILKEAVQRIIGRYDILRTTFHSMPGMRFPVQVIAETASPIWSEYDLESLQTGNIEHAIKKHLNDDLHSNTDLQQGPIVQITLLRINAQRSTCIMTVPALCADTRTLILLFDEIVCVYQEVLQAKAISSDEILQYVQFSEWQNDILTDGSDESIAGSHFWQNKHGSEFSDPHLPFEKIDLPVDSARFDVIEKIISLELVSQITNISQRYAVDLPVFLLTVWQTLLRRVTNERQITVWVAFDGRTVEELADSIGLFAKYIPIACSVDSATHLNDLLAETQAALSAVEQWQDYFSWEQTRPGGVELEAAGVGFEFVEYPPLRHISQLTFELYTHESQADYFSCKLSITLLGSQLRLRLYYDRGRHDHSIIQQIAACYVTLLSNSADNITGLLEAIELLDLDTQHQLLVEWNNTALDYDGGQCVHHLFEAQAERSPEQLAIVFEGATLTYSELNRRSNQLAHYLIRLGAAPGTLIGIYLHRSIDGITALLGILKSGCAYVPFDPNQPSERLHFLLHNTQVSILLTQRDLMPMLSEWQAHCICLDRDWHYIAQERGSNPSVKTSSEQLHHVIYTSGSTGQPKGIMVSHRSVINFWAGFVRRVYGDSPVTYRRVGLNAPLSFDGSIKQWLLLAHGSTLYIVPQEIRSDGSALLAFLQHNAIDIIDCTPSHIHILMTAGLLTHNGHMPSVVLISGEQIKEPMWSSLAQATHTRFYNVYGPTECTVDTTVYPIRPGTVASTIGRPLANTQAYILDRHMRPTPPGLPGELYIGGQGVAWGYLNNPELTAAKFLPHPFSSEPGARLYATGDIMRYLPDGEMQFLDRIDDQVKIRSFRIELGEIEAALARHPSIQSAVVVALADQQDTQRLVAYFVSRQAQPTTSELRRFLDKWLPEYMIPSVFIALDALPLTNNGKLDRRALPLPEAARPNLETAYVAPSTAIEQQLIAIWSELLGVEQIGINDNFLELGGHSLLVTQLMARVRAIFQIDPPLRRFFEDPTVKALARAISLQIAQQSDDTTISDLLAELEQLSDDDVARLLAD